MAKAVLVIDMPESCGHCNFTDFGADGILTCICIDDYMELEDDMYKRRPDWCPLRELPEHKRTIGTESESNQTLMNAGYNACLDKILKERKE